MKLEQSDAELFYQLWFPLLDFVNRKHHVCPETETIGQRKGIDARNAKKTLGCLLLYAARFDAYLCALHRTWRSYELRFLGQIVQYELELRQRRSHQSLSESGRAMAVW